MGWALLAVLVLLAFVPVWMAGKGTNMVQAPHADSWWGGLWLMARVHAKYLEQLGWFSMYSIVYPIEAGQPELMRGLIGLGSILGVVVLSVFAVVKRGAWRIWGLAGWTWICFLAPVSQVIFPLQNIIADRYMLLPSMAFAVALAAGLLRIGRRALRLGLLFGLLGISLMSTVVHTRNWASSERMYQQAVMVHPTWVEGLSQLAQLAAARGQLPEAQQWLERATEVDPYNPSVALRTSTLLVSAGQSGRAIKVLEAATAHSRNDKIRANLAILYWRAEQYDAALRWASEAVAIQPLVPHNQRALGLAALALGKFEIAGRAFEEALRLQPHHRDNHINMAVYYRQIQRPEKAEPHLRRAEALAH